MNGAEALIESLKQEKVDVVFGISGGAALPIYDAFATVGKDIHNILTRHEQGAAHMAEGYARSSGKVGVCLATSGPGATNLVTGIADAVLDSIPIVAITGQVPTTAIGTDAFQESDIMGITMPIIKHSFQPRRVEDVPRMIKEAFYVARTGRPGPVLVDIPRNVSTAILDKFEYPKTVSMRGYNPELKLDKQAIDEAVKLIESSEKPVLYVGGGVINTEAHRELLNLAEKNDIPVTTTLMGRGAFPDRHPLSLNMLGMHGTAYANWAVRDSDLLIAIGVRFDDRVTANLEKFARNARVIHVEVDPAEVHKNRHADVAILADAGEALAAIGKKIKKQSRGEWRRQIGEWKEQQPLRYTKNGLIKPQYIMEQIAEITDGEDILSTDVGQHQMWAAQFYPFKRPRQFLTSGGLGTMGYGLPAALGAKVANPDQDVWLVTGDGSFQMNVQELATSLVYKIPVKIALFNNYSLGMVKQWQDLFFEQRYSGIDLHKDVPNWEKLAEAYGAVGITVKEEKDVRPALEKAKEINDQTVLIDFHHDPKEHIYPMIASGTSVDEMKLQP